MSSKGLLNCETGMALMNCETGKALLHCLLPATYSTRAVAHIRAGNGGATGDWEAGLGTNTGTISNVAQYAWPNNSWVAFSLAYSGPDGTLTLTVGTGSVVWTPGTAIPNDASRWKLLFELYASNDRNAQIATQNVKLTVAGQDWLFDDMTVPSGSSAAGYTAPHQLGNQTWTVTGDIALGWVGTYPSASRLQAILRIQQEDT
jgi:hypothetical protein